MTLRAKTMRDVAPKHWDVTVRDRGRCVYCGLDGSQDIRVLGTLLLDHLIPRSANGTDDVDNLVLACPLCNISKGSWDPSNGNAKPPARKILIKRARGYVRLQRSRYFTALYKVLKSERSNMLGERL
jgi:hypothetical protein